MQKPTDVLWAEMQHWWRKYKVMLEESLHTKYWGSGAQEEPLFRQMMFVWWSENPNQLPLLLGQRAHMVKYFYSKVRGLRENVSFPIIELDSFIHTLQMKRFLSFMESVTKLVSDIKSIALRVWALKLSRPGFKALALPLTRDGLEQSFYALAFLSTARVWK